MDPSYEIIKVVPVEHGDVDVVSGEVGVPGDEGDKLGPAEDEGHGRQVALHGAVGAAQCNVGAPHDNTHQSYHLECGDRYLGSGLVAI